MRKVKNITVCVTPEIYREARHLAAEYDASVSAFVAYLLPRLRVALERTRFPKGGPKTPAQPSPAASPTPSPLPLTYPLPPSEKIAIPGCETVMPPLTSEISMVCSEPADVGTEPVKLYGGA